MQIKMLLKCNKNTDAEVLRECEEHRYRGQLKKKHRKRERYGENREREKARESERDRGSDRNSETDILSKH